MTAQEVKNIIIEYFTEELTDFKTDAECLSAYIRFPEIKVTNERGNSVKITELYVRLKVSPNGNYISYSLQMMRTEFTKSQLASGYVHSHLPRLNDDPVWASPCLGTGPLRSTLSKLERNPNKEFWGLFCFELFKYLQVESIQGIPYIHLEKIHNKTTKLIIGSTYNYEKLSVSTKTRYFWNDIKMNDFISYFIGTEDIPIAYIDSYCIGEHPIKFYLRVSNCFITWWNAVNPLPWDLDTLVQKGILVKSIIQEGELLKIISDDELRNLSLVGKYLFEFKGKKLHLQVKEDEEDSFNPIYTLNDGIIKHIIYKLIVVINYRYGEENNKKYYEI